MSNEQKISDLIGRIFISLIFLWAGIAKITDYAGKQGYMESVGVPGILLPLVIILEIGGAIAVVLGWKTRWAALALAIFCILSAFLFHFDFSNQMQSILFMKNIAIAGGFAVIFAHGAGQLSLDYKFNKS